jgi:hypothetical protein
MTLDFNKARKLCTQTELAVVVSARPSAMKSLTARRLQTKIARARNLRDKSRRREDRDKAELFGEVLRRFEARAAELDRREKAKSVPPGPRTRARSRRRRAETAAAARKQLKLRTSHVPRGQSHVSSRNRRQQGRRDAR